MSEDEELDEEEYNPPTPEPTKPIDPSSGKFIVSDIVPAKKSRAMLARAATKRPTVSTATRRTSPIKKPKPTPFKTSKDTEFEKWFRREKEETARTNRPSHPVRTEQFDIDQPPRKRSGKFFMFLLILLALVGGGAYVMADTFAKVHVVIEPKTQAEQVDTELLIAKDSSKPHIPGQVISVLRTKKADYPATGNSNIGQKASGTIVIYNASGTAPQILIASTRFQATNGKIYRISKQITVPGGTMENGKVTPGSIEAIVTAEQAGPDYNIAPTDFTIPGFKGTDKFKTFYARSKGPIQGGSTGSSKVVTAEDIEKAKGALEAELRDGVFQELQEKIPDGYQLLEDNAYEVTPDSKQTDKSAGQAGDSFFLEMTVSARAIVFKTEDLAAHIAQSTSFPENQVHLINQSTLKREVIQRNFQTGEMQVHISGNAEFAWDIDADEVKEAIISRKDPSEINQAFFAQFPAINKAQANFSPRWMMRIPKNPSHVTVEVVETGVLKF
jgi:hypothetical protein